MITERDNNLTPKARVIEHTLTDGSNTYDVEQIVGTTIIYFACTTEARAEQLAEALNDVADIAIG